VQAAGLHPLAGGRCLRGRQHAGLVVCGLVAHHTGAVVEAAQRGLRGPLLAEFPLEGRLSEQVIAVTYCDLTTGPRGERLGPQERIAEVLSRYAPDSPVHRAMQQAAPGLLGQCREVTAALRAREAT